MIIQSIDNDIRCDGTDPQNFAPYRQKLTAVMDSLTKDLPDADVFFVSQWGTVKEYDATVAKIDPGHITGSGPCDPIDLEAGRLLPRRELYLQRLVDRYWGIVTSVCAQYRPAAPTAPRCRSCSSSRATSPPTSTTSPSRVTTRWRPWRGRRSTAELLPREPGA